MTQKDVREILESERPTRRQRIIRQLLRNYGTWSIGQLLRWDEAYPDVPDEFLTAANIAAGAADWIIRLQDDHRYEVP